MEENRKKKKRKILPKRRNFVFVRFFGKIVRRRIVKHKFVFYQNFVSTRRATTRRVNITRGHMKRERIKKKKYREKSKENESLFRSFFLVLKQRDAKYFPKKYIENTENGKMFSRSGMKKQIYSKN